MTFSIIVPTCNRNNLLSGCLSLLSPPSQKSYGFDYELIVSDDGTVNNAETLIAEKYTWVKWIKGPKKGPAANRNNGAKEAKGEWLIFIDDDCLPDTDMINQYYIAFKNNPEVEVFEGRIKADGERKSFTDESPINESGGYLWSCNFMIKRASFLNIKGFDEGFPFAAMEDVDLDYRLRKTGKKIIFVEKAFVTHPWRAQKRMFYVTMQRFKSLLYFLKKHPQEANRLNSIYYLRIVAAGIKSLFANSFKYKFSGFWGGVVFIILHFYFSVYFVFYSVKTAE